MSERNLKPLQSPDEGAQQASAAGNGDAFQRAESLLAAGNEDRGERAREALAGIENRPAKDRAPPTNDADALTQSAERDHSDDTEHAANDKVDDALDEKAREEGVEAADDSSRIEWGLTPHNI